MAERRTTNWRVSSRSPRDGDIRLRVLETNSLTYGSWKRDPITTQVFSCHAIPDQGDVPSRPRVDHRAVMPLLAPYDDIPYDPVSQCGRYRECAPAPDVHKRGILVLRPNWEKSYDTFVPHAEHFVDGVGDGT